MSEKIQESNLFPPMTATNAKKILDFHNNYFAASKNPVLKKV